MDAVEDIKGRLNIEDVIGEYVQLKRSGRNFKGLSPFANEKTPSFMVSPEKQIWHDFSTGKGGNMFSFVMEMEGLDFRGALELLARKAGVDLEQYRGSRGSGHAKLKDRLYEANELAAKFYQIQFSKHRPALEYVLGTRQFSKQTALEWRLGYSPESGTALVDFLRSREFSAEEIRQAGLSAQRYRGVGDMFRGRLMIPLQDAQGRVIGFTARLLKDNKDAPKYINTPQTILYDKSRHVFGLHLAKDAIRRNQYVVLVEGNLDVISSHQAGVRHVVATAGTALTEPNLKALSRFTADIRLCFDADRAGVDATERAIPVASKVGVALSVITIPSGKDPDELIRQDQAKWQEIIAQHQYALDWLMERYAGLLDLTSAQGKKSFSDVMLPIVRRLVDSVEQDHYMQSIAQRLGIERSALTTKLLGVKVDPKPAPKPVPTPQQLDKVQVEYLKTQHHLLALLLLHPALRPHASLLRQQMLVGKQARDLFTYLVRNPSFKGEFDSPDQDMQDLAEYAKILLLQYEELYGDVEDLELEYEITRLQTRLIDQYIKIQKAKLTAQLAQAGTDEPAVRQLLERVRQLDNLRKQSQGGQRA